MLLGTSREGVSFKVGLQPLVFCKFHRSVLIFGFDRLEFELVRKWLDRKPSRPPY